MIEQIRERAKFISKRLKMNCDCGSNIVTTSMLSDIKYLLSEIDRLKAENEAETNLIAELVCLCLVPDDKIDMAFRRKHIGAGDYMGTGYEFLDAFYRIWEKFMEAADDKLYQKIRLRLDKIAALKGESK